MWGGEVNIYTRRPCKVGAVLVGECVVIGLDNKWLNVPYLSGNVGVIVRGRRTSLFLLCGRNG